MHQQQNQENYNNNKNQVENLMEIDDNEEENQNQDKNQIQKFDEFSKIYREPALGNYIRSMKNQSVKNFVSQICILSEANLLKELTNKIIFVEYFSKKNFLNKTHIEILVNCLYNTICLNKENYYKLESVFRSFSTLLANKNSKKIKFNFDWKIFYEIFLCQKNGSFEFNFRPFFFQGQEKLYTIFSKIHKYLNFTKEDLLFFQNIIKNLLISGNPDSINEAIGIIYIFLRKNDDFLNEEIQNLIFKLNKNFNNNNVEAYALLSRLAIEGKLLIDKESFINLIFEKLQEFFL
jgi:hypothetical protein